MSDLNNKHIPSDLNSLTAKDLRELVLIQIEHGQQAEKENAKLRKEVERFQKQTREMNQALLEVNTRAEKAEAKRDVLSKRSSWGVRHLTKEELKAHNIEQKIRGVSELLRLHLKFDIGRGCIIKESDAFGYIEQLRKELEK